MDNDKKNFELAQIFNAQKIANSMSFKTGTAIIQLLVIIFASIIFAQMSIGFSDLSAFRTGAFWANAGILFGEQYYAYYVVYDWLFTAFMKSDVHLVGDNGLIKQTDDLVDLFDENTIKLEKGIEKWNLEDKIETYKNNIKAHINKLKNKQEKYRLKGKVDKVNEYEKRIETSKELLLDTNDIEFLHIKGYTPVLYKDVVNSEKTYSTSTTRNSFVDLGAVRRKRFFKKGISKFLFSIFGGLLIFNVIIGGDGFGGRLAFMLFVIVMQSAWAIKDAYQDIYQIVIPNFRLRKRILLYSAEVKVTKEVKNEEINNTDNNANSDRL